MFKTKAEIDFIDFGEWDAKAQSAADPVDGEVFRSFACGYKRLLRIVVSARELFNAVGREKRIEVYDRKGARGARGIQYKGEVESAARYIILGQAASEHKLFRGRKARV